MLNDDKSVIYAHPFCYRFKEQECAFQLSLANIASEKNASFPLQA